MRKLPLIAFLSTCILAGFVFSAQAIGAQGGSPAFTMKSMEGTYYIPCACEGNAALVNGGSIHSAGMGKIVFDGKGGATITQFNLYTEIANQITRVVQDGLFVGGGGQAVFSWSYEVNSEGVGVLYDLNDTDSPAKDDPLAPSFMVTKANGKEVTEVYLILPQDFITFTPEPTHLIHVTAARR